MENQYKYYGRQVDPEQKEIYSDLPILQEQKNENDLRAFSQVFLESIRKTMMAGDKLFGNSLYENLPPQSDAFEHLERIIKNAGYILHEITRAMTGEQKLHDALFRIKIQIPLTKEEIKKAFTAALDIEGNSYRFASIYVGLCPEFAALVRKNQLIEEAIKEANAKDPRDSDTLALFEPDIALASLIESLRAERRYHYVSALSTDVTDGAYYKTPEGFLYRMEVDGYAAVEEITKPSVS